MLEKRAASDLRRADQIGNGERRIQMGIEVVDRTPDIAWRYHPGRLAQGVAVVMRVVKQQACQYKLRELDHPGRAPADRTRPFELDDRRSQHICKSAAVAVRKVHCRREHQRFDEWLAEQRGELSLQGLACRGQAQPCGSSIAAEHNFPSWRRDGGVTVITDERALAYRCLPHSLDRQMHPVVVPYSAGLKRHWRAVLSATNVDAGEIDAADTGVQLRGVARRNIESERHSVEERAGLLRVAAIKDLVPLQERPIEERRRAGLHLEISAGSNPHIITWFGMVFFCNFWI